MFDITAPGGWTPWASWSECDCQTPSRSRERECLTPPPPIPGAVGCTGQTEQVEECPPCVSSWSQWSECSRTCDFGSKLRTRTCINGECVNNTLEETEECNSFACPGLFDFIYIKCFKNENESIHFKLYVDEVNEKLRMQYHISDTHCSQLKNMNTQYL